MAETSSPTTPTTQREEQLHYHTIVNIEHLSNDIEIQKFKKKDKEINDEGQQSKQLTIVGTPSSTTSTSTPRSTEGGEIRDHTIINIGQDKDEEKEINGEILILRNPDAEFQHMMIIRSPPRKRNHPHIYTEDSPLSNENNDFSHYKRRIRDRIHRFDGNPNNGCGFACCVYAIIIFCIALLWMFALRVYLDMRIEDRKNYKPSTERMFF